MKNRKYITYTHFDGYPAYVIFDPMTNHKQIARQLSSKEFLGAGFVNLAEKGAYCVGESVSMNIASRGKDDEKIINRGM